MEETKKKKKKLTLSGFAKKTHNAPNYAQSRGKTSIVIEKKAPKRWGERKFQSRDSNFNKPKSTERFVSKKTTINRNFDVRKMAEERATKRYKNIKENVLQQKKGAPAKEKSFANSTSIEECLAEEIILASNNDQNSFAIKKKNEQERIAMSSR